jgi:hypothetical protein
LLFACKAAGVKWPTLNAILHARIVERRLAAEQSQARMLARVDEVIE